MVEGGNAVAAVAAVLPRERCTPLLQRTPPWVAWKEWVLGDGVIVRLDNRPVVNSRAVAILIASSPLLRDLFSRVGTSGST
jgi:hypothetical protein